MPAYRIAKGLSILSVVFRLMSPFRVFQILAIIHGAIGCLIAVMMVPGVIMGVRTARKGIGESWAMAIFPVAMFLMACLISGFLIRGGWVHLKRPDQKSALALAGNTAVILWFLIRGSLGSSHSGEWIGPACSLGSILAAYLAHRFFLKPAALRAFPPVESRG